jgi:hypothetical protein
LSIPRRAVPHSREAELDCLAVRISPDAPVKSRFPAVLRLFRRSPDDSGGEVIKDLTIFVPTDVTLYLMDGFDFINRADLEARKTRFSAIYRHTDIFRSGRRRMNMRNRNRSIFDRRIDRNKYHVDQV